VDYKDGILFISGNKRNVSNYCIEKNDSIKSYHLKGKPFDSCANYHIAQNGDLITQHYNGNIFRTAVVNGRFHQSKIGQYSRYEGRLLNNYLLPSLKKYAGDTQLIILNVDDGSEKVIPILRDENTLSIEHQGNYYISTGRRVYKLDKHLKTKILKFEEDRTDMPAIITTIVDDSMWGRCVATTNKGLYIELPSYKFKRSKHLFATARYVGHSVDSNRYLWNRNDRRLTIIDKKKNISYLPLPDIHEVRKVLPLSIGRSVLLTDRSIYMLIDNCKKFVSPLTSRIFNKINDSFVYKTGRLTQRNYYDFAFIDCLVSVDSIIHAAEIGYGYSIIRLHRDSLVQKSLDSDRYHGIAYYQPSASYIAYGRNNILVHRDNDTSVLKLKKEALALLGIRNIRGIWADNKNGSILIHSNDRLFILNMAHRSFRLLFKNYNLKDAHILLRNDNVIAIGRFGVISCCMSGSAENPPAKSLVNFKSSFYNHIYDTYFIGDDLFLDTDLGLYEIPLSDALKNDAFIDFRPAQRLFVSSAEYNNIVSSGDTFLLQQDEPSMSFDFINPYGSGALKYSYSIGDKGTAVHYLSEQINLPVLKPGKYYTLSVSAIDDLWKSNPYTLYLYVVPRWWETTTGRRWIVIIVMIGLIGLAIIAILTTRHILVSRHIKQYKYMELELKSIYAQLNPHFIFNTLGNIIYFVRQNRNKEAYRQLNVFSNLLRSYIKSSRNKWVTIAEEAENLNNYILLQQSRFEGKFDYTIDITEELDTANIFIPALLLQPLVENAIHHGLQQQTERGKLTVRFGKGENADTIVITVDDNGIGRIRSKELRQKTGINTESYGTSLLEDLVSIFKYYELCKVNIQYIDKVFPVTGTTVIVTIKYNL
jgi:hypothetical protein